MGGSTSKDRGMEVGENRGGEGSRGKGKERAMSPSTIWRKFTPIDASTNLTSYIIMCTNLTSYIIM